MLLQRQIPRLLKTKPSELYRKRTISITWIRMLSWVSCRLPPEKQWWSRPEYRSNRLSGTEIIGLLVLRHNSVCGWSFPPVKKKELNASSMYTPNMTHSRPIMKWMVSPLMAVTTLSGIPNFPSLGLLSVFFFMILVRYFKFERKCTNIFEPVSCLCL